MVAGYLGSFERRKRLQILSLPPVQRYCINYWYKDRHYDVIAKPQRRRHGWSALAVSLSTSVAGKGRGLGVAEEVRVLTVAVLHSSSHAVRPTPLFLRQRFYPNTKSPTAKENNYLQSTWRSK